MKLSKYLMVGIALALFANIANATIYTYTAKDGKSYYTNELPTGLTAAEKAKFKSVTTTAFDALTKADPNKYKQVHDRNQIKALLKADATLLNCEAPTVLNVALNKCETPVVVCEGDTVRNPATNRCDPVVKLCEPPTVRDPATNKCVVLDIPSTPTSIAPPKTAIFCNGNQEKCTIAAGITAKVWFGVANKWVTKDNMTGTFGCNADVMGDPNSGAYNRCFYVDNKLLEKVLDPKGVNNMPAVNTALVPVGSKGFSVPMIKAAAIPPAEKGGAFRISCEYSHMSNDDPIVFPGVPNATHHHTFFGNTGVNAYTTTESVHNSGNGTCAGGTLNRSGYWMPSLINTLTNAPVKPSGIVVYYKSIDEYTNETITPPPPGLRMIAGNAKPLAVVDAEGGFYCQDQTQVMNPVNWGIVWQGNHIKQSCGGPQQMLRMIVSFPQCWDGKNLDSPDHKSHMAYACGDECPKADGKVGKNVNSCPASHPVPIPNITLNVDFRDLDPNAKYRLASDNYSSAYPGGYSAHADWMNGWDEKIMSRMVKGCLNNPKNCGGPNLGDGETLYGVNQD